VLNHDPELRREMQDKSGRTSVPQIFIGDRHIGGYEDLAKLDADGELDSILGID
jgi:glutaredoxin 3